MNENEVIEMEVANEGKVKTFFRKHWKKITAGLVIVAGVVAGVIFLGKDAIPAELVDVTDADYEVVEE